MSKGWRVNSWSSGEARVGGGDHDQCPPVMFGGHVGVKIAGHQVLGLGLARAPFHEEAVGQATNDAQHEHGVGMSNAATIVILRDVEPLVQAVFDAAEAATIEPQPGLGIQLLGRGAGEQGDGLRLTAGGLAADSGYLCGRRETDRLRGSRGGAENADFIPAAIALLGACACARRFLRGERLPESPAAAFLSYRESRAGCL